MRKGAALAGSLLLLSTLTACGPAIQPPNPNQATHLGTGVSASTWNDILKSAENGETVSMYKEQVAANLAQGSLHSGFGVYGVVNLPDTASYTIQEANDSVHYYQQGTSAYSYDNGQWTPVSAVPSLNVFPSYVHLIEQAMNDNVALYQIPKTYVVNEYCDVYQSIIPAKMFTTESMLPNVSPGDIGPVLMTWYVGQTDHILREVDVQSVGGVPGYGSMQINASTILFDFNSPISKIQIPKDLVKQLQGSGN